MSKILIIYPWYRYRLANTLDFIIFRRGGRKSLVKLQNGSPQHPEGGQEVKIVEDKNSLTRLACRSVSTSAVIGKFTNASAEDITKKKKKRDFDRNNNETLIHYRRRSAGNRIEKHILRFSGNVCAPTTTTRNRL